MRGEEKAQGAGRRAQGTERRAQSGERRAESGERRARDEPPSLKLRRLKGVRGECGGKNIVNVF